MDKKEAPPFAWMAAAMPGVAALVAEKRRLWGNEHVTDCLKRGLRGEPGFFFARQGVIAVGTPWDGDPVLVNFAARHITLGQALLVMKSPGGSDGTH